MEKGNKTKNNTSKQLGTILKHINLQKQTFLSAHITLPPS